MHLLLVHNEILIYMLDVNFIRWFCIKRQINVYSISCQTHFRYNELMHKLHVCYFTYSTENILLVRGDHCVGNSLRSDLSRLLKCKESNSVWSLINKHNTRICCPPKLLPLFSTLPLPFAFGHSWHSDIR